MWPKMQHEGETGGERTCGRHRPPASAAREAEAETRHRHDDEALSHVEQKRLAGGLATCGARHVGHADVSRSDRAHVDVLGRSLGND